MDDFKILVWFEDLGMGEGVEKSLQRKDKMSLVAIFKIILNKL